METILQGLLDMAGVHAGMVFGATGQLVGHRADAVYDRALCEQLSGNLIKAIDYVALQQPDWESVSAQFANGRIFVRNLGDGPGGVHYLAMVADESLNASFATVALRVASNKLKRLLAAGVPASAPVPSAGSSTAVQSAGSSMNAGPASSAGSPSTAALSAAAASARLAGSGVSWSSGASSVAPSGASSMTPGGLAVTDPAASTFLTRCTRELARFVGPMAKLYVVEAVRHVSPGAPFTLTLRGKLVEELAAKVKERNRAQFLDAVEKGSA